MSLTAAELLTKVEVEFDCKRTSFYNRMKDLKDLNYDLEPTRNGRESYYSDEQIQVVVDYLSWIASGKNPDEFPKSEREAIIKQEENGHLQVDSQQNLQTFEPSENYNRRLDERAQLEAAKLDLLSDVYRITGNYTLPGLAQEIQEGKEQLHKYHLAKMGNVSSLIPESVKKSLSPSPERMIEEDSE
ncbi:MAG: hypothetical protein WBA93_19915 [Microcoleaceae cyanobacterium]